MASSTDSYTRQLAMAPTNASAFPFRAERLSRCLPNPKPDRPVKLLHHLRCHLADIPRLVRRQTRPRF
eukprot:459758-Pleurochrysis_carterae.AAC.1